VKSKAFVFILLVGGFLGVQFLYPALTKKSHREIVKAQKGQAVTLEFENYKVSPPLVASADSVLAVVKSGPLSVPINCDATKVSGWFGLLSGLKGSVTLDSLCYEGVVNGKVSKSILNDSFSADFETKGLNVAGHPLLKFFGLAGKIDLSLDSEGIVEGQDFSEITKVDLNLSTDSLSFSGDQKIGGLIKIPVFFDLDADAGLTVDGKSFDSKELSLTSSLGSAKGKFSGLLSTPLPDVKLKTLQGNFEIVLSEEGVKELAGFLALAAGDMNKSKAAKWKINFRSGQAKGSRTQPTFMGVPMKVDFRGI